MVSNPFFLFSISLYKVLQISKKKKQWADSVINEREDGFPEFMEINFSKTGTLNITSKKSCLFPEKAGTILNNLQ